MPAAVSKASCPIKLQRWCDSVRLPFRAEARCRHVEAVDVINHHPARAERGRVRPHRAFADADPTFRYTISLPIVIERDDRTLNQVIDRKGFRGVLSVTFESRWLNPPTVAIVRRPALTPPTIKDAQIRHSICRGLHPARAACLERRARVVEPDIDTRDKERRQPHIVILGKRYATAEARILSAPADFLNEQFPAVVC